MDKDNFLGSDDFNENVISKNLTLDDLKVYLSLKFPSVRESAVPAGLSEGRVRQILIGYHLPKSAKLIYQIAKGWQIDPVKLSLLFDNVQKTKGEQASNETSAVSASDSKTEEDGEEKETE